MAIEKPLKRSGVTRIPRQFTESADYAAIKGVSYEGLSTHQSEKIGGLIMHTIPDCSWKPTFHTAGANDGEIDFVELFEGATQTTINRRARVDMTYDGSLNPTVEAWKIYDPSDGTTIVRTVTITHTWSGVDLTKSTEVTT